MLTGHDTARAAYLQGDVTPDSELIVHAAHLDFTWARHGVTTHGSVIQGDDHHTLAGLHFPWGDGAIIGSDFVWLWCDTQWGGDGYWYSRKNDADAQEMYGSPPAIDTRSRPGVVALNSTTARVFYISDNNKLMWRNLPVAELADWSTTTSSLAGDLADSNGVVLGATSYTVAPISSTACYVFGYSAPLVWVCRFDYVSDAWVPGTVHYLASKSGLPWATIFNADAETLGSIDVLVAPSSARAVQAFSAENGLYGPFNWLIASPEVTEEGGQRVLVHSLAAIGTRIWAVVSAEVDGGKQHFYAQRTHLLSTANGKDWRDEGLIAQGAWPLKAETIGDYLILMSACSYGSVLQNWRLNAETSGTVAELATGIALGMRRPAIGTSQLEAKLLGEDLDSVLEVGSRIEWNLGVQGDLVPIFRGYVDAIGRQEVLGDVEYNILARGDLSRLVGETSYVPLTTLTWNNRMNWYTRFYLKEERQAVMGLAAEQGDWTYKRIGQSDWGTLICTKSEITPAIATAPQPIDTNDAWIYCRMRNGGPSMGVTFWHDDAAEVINDYWMVLLEDATLRIYQVSDNLPTLKASASSGDYNLDDEVEFHVHVDAGSVDAYVKGARADSDPSGWARVTYTGWEPAGSELFAPRNRWLCGVIMEPTAEGYVYEFGICDGSEPHNLRTVLYALAELTGIDCVFATASYLDIGDPSHKLRHVDINVTMTTSTPDLMIAGYTISLRDNRAYLGRYTVGGTKIWEKQAPFAFPTTVSGKTFRIVATDNCVSIHYAGRLLTAFHVDVPIGGSYVSAVSGCSIEVLRLSDMALPGGLSWGFNENAASILSTLLQQRRVYLMEWPDGTIHIGETYEGSNTLPFQGITSYDGIVFRDVDTNDLRNTASVIGVLASDYDVSGVYLINSEAIRTRAKTITQSSPWALSRSVALADAIEMLKDQWRQMRTRELLMLPDLVLCIGDVITLADGWQGVVRDISVTLAHNNNSLELSGTVQAWEKWQARLPKGRWDWVSSHWGSCSWG